MEKTAQVQMMADIYSETEEVLIWLGEEPKARGPIFVRDLPGANMLAYDVRSAGKSTFKQVQENDSIAFKHAITNGGQPDFASIASLFSHLASGGHLCKLKHFTKWSTGDGLMRPAWDWFMVMKALKDFSRLPWFSRTWTVQEVCLLQIQIESCFCYNLFDTPCSRGLQLPTPWSLAGAYMLVQDQA